MSLCLMGLPGLAHAQSETLGFRVGEKSKLHTSLTVSTVLDTNSNRTDNREDDGVEDVRLVVRPALRLDVPGRSFEFKLGFGATISQFLGTGAAAQSDTLFGFDGRLFLRLGSNKSPVAFTLENTPTLTPTVIPDLGTIGADERRFDAFTDIGRALFTFRPGGGALEIDVGYKNQFTVFIRDQANDGSPDDGFNHVAFVESRLKFLPKTAALFYADFGFFEPTNPDRAVITRQSNPFSVMLGLIGQITRTISAEVRVGYGESLTWALGQGRFSMTDPANQRTVVALSSVTWQIIRTVQVSATYQRSVQPSVALSNFVSDAFRFRGSWSIDRLILGGYFEAQLRNFGTQFDVNDPLSADVNPNATLIFAGARADYYFFEWLSAGLNYRVITQSSNDDARALAEGNTDVIPALGSFTRHQVFANLTVSY